MVSQQNAKLEIAKLIEQYQKIANEGRINSYNEANTRKNFILPFFEALGWDVYSEDIREEEKASKGRVDYAFCLNKIPKFFLEAKSLKVDLNEPQWAEQAVNYAWHKGVTWAILTDFEGIKVFNAEWKLKSQMPVFEWTWEEYIEKFEEIWWLSKESFENNVLLEQAKKKWKSIISKSPVGKQLYDDMMDWREKLTKSIKVKRQEVKLDEELIDECVQRILDRLIFIRTCEDRELEPATLKAKMREWEFNRGDRKLIHVLSTIFRDFDEGYNSNIFKEHLCEKLNIDDDVLYEIIKGLYETKDHSIKYDFSAIDSDVLGGIYEQYLGHILKKERVVKKHQHRKEQGIYYTPTYIVDYIVKNTLGELLKAKSYREVMKLKILDPACGSGSFLIKAFEVMDNYLKEARSSKGADMDYLRRFEILSGNIYGVDLDKQAVEIARLNLALKTLTTREKLPMLKNIRQGNSLISGSESELREKLGSDWKDKHPFNWKQEFPEVFKDSGFDVIIGNPPYIKEYTNRSAFDALHDTPYYQGKMDIWTLFACTAIDLLKDGGYFSFIAPNNWLTNAGASIFRDKILLEGQITYFVDFGDFKVFKDAGIQTMIFVFKKGISKKSYQTTYAKITDRNISEDAVNLLLQSNLKTSNNGITRFNAALNPQHLIGKTISFSNKTNEDLLRKFEAKRNFSLTEKEVAQGIVGDPDKAFVFSNEIEFNKNERKVLFKYFTSVGKYTPGEQRGLIAYLDKNIIAINNYPLIRKQLDLYATQLKNRREVKNGRIKLFHLHWPRDKKYFDKGPKIVSAIRTKLPNCFYTEEEYFGSRAMNFIKTDRINLKYLTGLLNSRVTCYWLKNKGKQLGDLLQIDKGPLLNIPLIKPNDKIQSEIAYQVDKVTKIYQEFRNISANTEKWFSLKAEIERVEQQIDEASYKLYELTKEEIKIIESVTI